MDYENFIADKSQMERNYGFEPLWMPDFLFPFQRNLTEWALRKGRAAEFADCGLGKTPMELVWAAERRSKDEQARVDPYAIGGRAAIRPGRGEVRD